MNCFVAISKREKFVHPQLYRDMMPLHRGENEQSNLKRSQKDIESSQSGRLWTSVSLFFVDLIGLCISFNSLCISHLDIHCLRFTKLGFFCLESGNILH